MTDKNKTEVNLEICSGFFRIPTDDIVYNITVLASNEPSTTKIVEKIIEVEKIVEVEKKTPAPAASSTPVISVAAPAIDEYFKQTAHKFQQEIALAAQEIGSTPTSAGGGPDMNAIKDLAAMSTDLKEVLLSLKKHALASGPATNVGASTNLSSALEQLLGKIIQAKGLCGVPSEEATVQTYAPSTKTATRYLFNVDTVFQTIYELCTNETVKTHIKNARAKADEIFNKDIFYDAISPKVSSYPEDDGFMNVPMSDIYSALGAACTDKGIGNLLVKMDKQQADIFLDQFLLMEIPASEEVIVIDEESAIPAGNAPSPSTNVDGEVIAILSECQASLDKLIYQSADQGAAQPADRDDFINSIDDAISIAASIQSDANRLVKDNAGGSVNPLWIKIKSLAALTEEMLRSKEADSSLSFASGLQAGQAAVQRCINELQQRTQAAAGSPPKKEALPTKAPAAQENFGEASQDDIDRLLEELG